MSANPETAVEYTWQAHPAGERVGAAVLGGAVVAAIAAAVLVTTGSLGWAALSIAVLGASLNRFYLRSRFEIDAEGISARFPLRTLRLPWTDVRRFVVDGHGGYLSTRSTRSWLDAYRGMHILFGADRDAVIERIRSHVRREAAS